MPSKKKIEEFKKKLQEESVRDQFELKFLIRPLDKYQKVRYGRAKNKIEALADMYRKLVKYEEYVQEAIISVSEKVFNEFFSDDSVDNATKNVYFPNDEEYVEVKRINREEDVAEFEVRVNPILTGKEWDAAIAQFQKNKASQK